MRVPCLVLACDMSSQLSYICCVRPCVDCIKKKFIKTKKKGTTRSSDLLEIIHIDINGPLTPIICGNKFLITFINDFCRYGYLYLIKEKSKALEKFKICKTEVEKQLGKIIKIVRFDYSGDHSTIHHAWDF